MRTRPAPVTGQSRCAIARAAADRRGGRETSEFLRQSRILWDRWPANRPEGMTGPLFVPARDHFSVVADYADPASDLTRRTLALF